jgi:hypothetical protein
MEKFFPSWLRRKNKPETIKEIPQEPEEIKDAGSFEELFEILKRKGGLTGSDGTFYSAEELIERIQKLRSGEVEDLAILTRSEGLRDKVEELLKRELEIKKRELEIKTSLGAIKAILQHVESSIKSGGDARPQSQRIAELLRSISEILKQYPENERAELIKDFEIDKLIKDIKAAFQMKRMLLELHNVLEEISNIKESSQRE